ncbi:MAG TPA: Crp/Fnr family transcriptional regulator [Bryobacteraceae bacterium]|nr:Crp/Fnr family transcriptional regulator [Bryobacteraceae bacterium]
MPVKITRGAERSLFEDPLSYLPRSGTREFKKGQLIYDVQSPPPDLYLVIKGCVKVTRLVGHTEVVMSICQADDFFGESAFVQAGGERASAIETTKVMTWPVEAVVELVLRRPPLGIGIIQLLTCRCFDLGRRIATMSSDSTARRLAKALLDLAERLGQPDPESREAKRIAPFPHKMLAQYIGTTREAVTHCMNQFRRQNFVSYTRQDMKIYHAPLREWLGSDYTPTPSVCLPAFTLEMTQNSSLTA